MLETTCNDVEMRLGDLQKGVSVSRLLQRTYDVQLGPLKPTGRPGAAWQHPVSCEEEPWPSQVSRSAPAVPRDGVLPRDVAVDADRGTALQVF